MKVKHFISFLIVLMLFSGCSFNEQNVSENKTPEQNASTSKRTAENFIIHTERGPMSDENYICYQESDGTLTKIIKTSSYEQPLMIVGETIYYVQTGALCPAVNAIDFYGNAVASIELDKLSFFKGWLLYSDESYIYGVGGNTVYENANTFFKVDLELRDYSVLSALPAEFRTTNLDKLAADLREAVGNHTEDIYVHRATARLDANGMFYELGLQITAKQENKIVYGNLLFDWYYQDKDYKNQANPWFNRLDEGFEATSDPLPLETFLEYVQTIGLSGVVPSTLSNAIYDYKLYWNGGMSGISYPQKDDILIRYVKFEDNAFHPTVPLTQLPELHFVVENWDYSKTIAATDSYASDFIATEILYIFFP